MRGHLGYTKKFWMSRDVGDAVQRCGSLVQKKACSPLVVSQNEGGSNKASKILQCLLCGPSEIVPLILGNLHMQLAGLRN